MNTPPSDPDDPRLTAYALGEADEADRKAVEKMLAESAETRLEIEQIRAFARDLTSAFAREHEVYLATRAETELPSNVVAFRNRERRSWHRAAVLTFKAAAMVTVVASLFYVTIRKPRRPDIPTASAAPPVEMGNAATPAFPAADQLSKDKLAATQEMDRRESAQSAAGDQTGAAIPEIVPGTPAGSSADAPLAMDRSDDPDQKTEIAASTLAPRAFSKTEAPPPASMSEIPEVAPGAARATGLAAPRPSKPAAPDEQIARPLVRIRTAAGVFSGGVVISPDGLILAAAQVPEISPKQPSTIVLSDHRELPAGIGHAIPATGWSLLRVSATALPAATLATELPANDASLLVVSVHPQTGVVTFSHPVVSGANSLDHVIRLRGDGNASPTAFAFNSAGELLVLEAGTRGQEKTAASKRRSDSRNSVTLFVRPFTPAERAAFLQAGQTTGRH